VLISCWSLKGGSGTTVVSVALASLLGRRHAGGALVVDLGGDVPAVVGLADGSGPEVAEWLAAGDAVAPDGWGRLEHPVAPHLAVVHRGRGPLPAGARAEVLAGVLATGGRPVVVDCGVLAPAGEPGSGVAVTGAHVLAAAATHSLLVTRACYLSLRRCARLPLLPSGVVLVTEPSRALTAADVEAVVGVPVVAEVPCDAAVARAADAGSLAGALPRRLERALRDAA
jgi:hypothetical protein